MKAFRQTILELSANDKLDKLGHKPLSGSRLKQLAKSYITFEDIDLDQWQGYPPPSNSSQVTKNEIHNLISLGQNRDKWERDMVMHDKTIMQAFKEYLDEHGLEVDLDRIKKIKNDSHPILLSLKRYYNRPRPQVLAKKIGLDLSFFPLKTAETPSYPSGHAAQGRLVAKLIADEVPLEHRRNILDIGERVGYSRQVAGAHYVSDTEFGHRLGDELYRLASTRQEPDLKLEDVLSELEVANKAALAKYIGDLKTGKMRASTVVKYTDSGETSTVGKEMPDAATDDDEDEKDKKEPKSKEDSPEKNAVSGNPEEGDNKVKNEMLEHGFHGVEDATGNKPAPGTSGSAFNEIVSGEGVHILEENPDMSEDELAQEMFDRFGSSGLGQEQDRSSEIKANEYPEEIKENLKEAKAKRKAYLEDKYGKKKPSKEELAKDKKYQKHLESVNKAEQDKATMSKCIITARSSKQKHANSTRRTKDLQDKGKLGTETKTHTFYGADDSKKAQIDIIKEAKKRDAKVLLPNGEEVKHEDAIAFIDAGGGGPNPADTGTFVTDEKGNVLVQFHSDKMSTGDIQDNSTLAKEGDNYKGHIDNTPNLTTEQKKKNSAIVDKYDKKMKVIEDNYNDQATPIAKKLEELDIDEQVAIIEESKGTEKKNLRTALRSASGGVKKQYKKYMPEGKTKFDQLSTKEQYEIIQKIVSAGEGKGNDTKIINKVAEAVVKKNPDQEGLDVKGNLAAQRKKVVDLQRKRVDELNKTKVKVDGVEKGLGDMMEADETIRSLHLGLMDDHEYGADDPNQDNRFKGIMDSAFDVNMGGALVNGEVLKKCIGVKNTTEMKQKFELRKPEGKTSYTYDDNDNITGKKVYIYSIDDKGNRIEIGYKTYRSKQGADGKTQNTMQYSKHMQDCFKRGQKNEQIEKGRLLGFNEWNS